MESPPLDLHYSFVIPVYNRPGELRELLGSMVRQDYGQPFEVLVVEDGSARDSEAVIAEFADRLMLRYFRKANTGPGDSRNYGMQRAAGRYFLLTDSDCILPENYLSAVDRALKSGNPDCFGGPDAAHPDFDARQQAISFAMTSPLTTGGIRGSRSGSEKFQPRSFNMGISREAFAASGGFGDLHPGEDPDLSLRLKALGFTLGYIPDAVVYHKRRIRFPAFLRQVYKFGLARPILNRWHPGSARPVYWFPTLFLLGSLVSIFLALSVDHGIARVPAAGILGYLTAVWLTAWKMTGSLKIACLALWALLLQFAGYGWGFLKSTFLLTFSSRKPEALFPELFFNS